MDTDYTFKISENFFDLTPGWNVTVKILSNHSLKSIKKELRIVSVYDSYQNSTS